MDNASVNITEFDDASRQKFRNNYFFSISVSMWTYYVVRIALSVIFIWSGISKLFDPTSFAVILEAYGLFPDILIIPAAILLSLAEVIAGMGLLFDIRGTLAAITIMLVLFMTILVYGIWLGLDIDCGCFGPEDPETKVFHSLPSALFKDMILFVGLIYLYVYRYIKSLKPINVTSVLNKIDKTRRGCK
ncbi:MAG: DoxX family membrane protein [Deltaproteobacteria bacterium]|nr:DoxX family membrane protein [Deltaproteobacteria bacterium]